MRPSPETGEEPLAEGAANLVAIDRAFRPQDLPERVLAALSVKDSLKLLPSAK